MNKACRTLIFASTILALARGEKGPSDYEARRVAVEALVKASDPSKIVFPRAPAQLRCYTGQHEGFQFKKEDVDVVTCGTNVRSCIKAHVQLTDTGSKFSQYYCNNEPNDLLEDTCVKAESGDFKVTACSCQSDLCNGALKTSTTSLLGLLLMTAFIRTLLH